MSYALLIFNCPFSFRRLPTLLTLHFIFVIGCQSPTASETAYSLSEEESSTGETIVSTNSVSQIEAVQQKVRQVQQLQVQLRNGLDSLYDLEATSELQARTDTLESIYFDLADAEKAWENLRTQYTDQFDSLNNISNTDQIQGFEPALEALEQRLERSLHQADMLLSP